MSKIGKKPIPVPIGVQVSISEDDISITGKEGKMNLGIPRKIKVKSKEGIIMVERANDEKKTKSLHGLLRQLIFNAVVGVETPWEKRLEIVGTGFNVKLQGQDLVMKLGYSHPVVFKKAEGITFKVEGNNKIVLSGIDKQLVGQVAYQIKLLKLPDVYKGKGIRYEGEKLRIKPGKKAKVAGPGTA